MRVVAAPGLYAVGRGAERLPCTERPAYAPLCVAGRRAAELALTGPYTDKVACARAAFTRRHSRVAFMDR